MVHSRSRFAAISASMIGGATRAPRRGLDELHLLTRSPRSRTSSANASRASASRLVPARRLHEGEQRRERRLLGRHLAERDARPRPRVGVALVVPDQLLGEQRQVLDRAREEPDVSRVRESWKHAGARDEPVGRLEAVDAAERRRPDHGAAGLAAERERHHAGRHRGGRAARRAAGRVGGVVRVARLAGRAGRELGGHGLAHDDGARRAQRATTVASRDGVRPAWSDGAVLGRHVGGVDDVLDARPGTPWSGPSRPARQPPLVGGAAPAPARGRDRGTPTPGRPASTAADARQARLDQLRGADDAVADQPRRVRRRRVEVANAGRDRSEVPAAQFP